MKLLFGIQSEDGRVILVETIEELVANLYERPNSKIFLRHSRLLELSYKDIELNEVTLDGLLDRFVTQQKNELEKSALILQKILRVKKDTQKLSDEFEIITKFEYITKKKEEEKPNEEPKKD